MTLQDKIKAALSNDLLDKQWQGLVKKYKLNKYAGHCYTASEAFYHLKGKELGYKPYYVSVMSFSMWDTIVTHWYLKKGDHIIDLTREQFDQSYVPYEEGKCCGFLTKKPCKRTQKLLEKIS